MSMILPTTLGPSLICAVLALAFGFAVYHASTVPGRNPLRKLAGPPVRTLFGNHMTFVLDPSQSPKTHAQYIKKYGRNIRIRGIGPWDDRLLPLDPASVSHVLKNSTIYEKPWQSRRLIASLIGCGMLAAEGHVHRRQRWVATPAFSIQNLRALVPLVFRKGDELQDRWTELLDESLTKEEGSEINNESDELFAAYKEMFEIALSQNNGTRMILGIYFPYSRHIVREWAQRSFRVFPDIPFAQPDERVKTMKRCHTVINRVAGKLIQSKKTRIMEGEKSGIGYTEKDLLSLLRG
ncbi:cytochrome P450 [Lanmaoa asiatica]|nr:cytochrome P450 [Lanmaoa asiatica]